MKLSQKDQATLRRAISTFDRETFEKSFKVSLKTARRAANDEEVKTETKETLREQIINFRTKN